MFFAACALVPGINDKEFWSSVAETEKSTLDLVDDDLEWDESKIQGRVRFR